MRRTDEHLTDKHQRIIQRVARGEDWRAAARAEGCSASYAAVIRTRMMKNPAAVRELEAIRDEGRKLAVYDLAKAMQEAAEVIEFAKLHKHPTAYFFAVRHRAHLSGLLVDKIQLETTVDLKGALIEARTRVVTVLDLTPGHVSAAKVLTAAAQPVTVPGSAVRLSEDGGKAWQPFRED